jgi:hypothetical protein
MTRKEKRRKNKRKNDVSLGADWTFTQKVYGIIKTITTQRVCGLWTKVVN